MAFGITIKPLEEISQLPYQVYLQGGAYDDKGYNDDGVNLDCFLTEQILHVNLSEEMPASAR